VVGTTTHVEFLEQIVSMISGSDTPIQFQKVKAHTAVGHQLVWLGMSLPMP